MPYNRRCNWSSYNAPEGRTGTGKPKAIPEEILKNIARGSFAGGRFKCPECNETYGVEHYSKFGSFSLIKAPTFHCIWCVKKNASNFRPQ